MSNNSRLMRRLEEVLASEYQALMAGEISALEELGSQKLIVLEEVAGLPIEQVTQFEGLRAKLLRNQLLAHSALEGMRVAIARARETSEIAQSLKTYGSDGQPSSIRTRAGGTLSKRS